MGKKKHAEEHENLERWLVSYADFITLLFATFVVLYALSQLDLAKFKDLQISLKKAFSSPSIVEGDQGILEKSGDSVLSEETGANSVVPPLMDYLQNKVEEKSFDDVKSAIDKMDKKEGLKADINDRGLAIDLVDNVFFDSGRADVRKEAYPQLEKVAKMIKDKLPDYPIRIEGHTDSVPIKASVLYPSNWELSSARASNVVRFMIGRFDFDKKRFAAVGYADSKPVASNSTDSGRMKNRRVEIVILKNKYIDSEPPIPGLKQVKENKINEYKKHHETKSHPQKTTAEAPAQLPVVKSSNSKGLSDAAKQLLEDSGQSEHGVLNYQDSYDVESQRIFKEIKEKENKAKH